MNSLFVSFLLFNPLIYRLYRTNFQLSYTPKLCNTKSFTHSYKLNSKHSNQFIENSQFNRLMKRRQYKYRYKFNHVNCAIRFDRIKTVLWLWISETSEKKHCSKCWHFFFLSSSPTRFFLTFVSAVRERATKSEKQKSARSVCARGRKRNKTSDKLKIFIVAF